jgi:hypothetical protein
MAIEVEERDRLQAFKGEIEEVRNKYLEEIKKLTETAKNSKEQIEAKVFPLLSRWKRSSSRTRPQPSRTKRSRRPTFPSVRN